MSLINPLNKPVVFYKGKAIPFSDRAMLVPVNHPNHLDGHEVSNGQLVTTSKVISWSLTTGCIETQNTIYTPFIDDNQDNTTETNSEIIVKKTVKFPEVRTDVLQD